MIALILCAGLGTRLRPLTNNIPKPMVKLGKYPVLSEILNLCLLNGITKIIVNLHYKSQVIMDYYGDGLIYFYEPVLLGERGTISRLSNWLKDEYTVVLNGDTYTDIDIQRMFRFSKGRSIRSMDCTNKDIYTGCKILSPDYFKGDDKFIDYYDTQMFWIDIGTPEGLKKARQKYEELNSMRELS